jgi:hypothetical protein
MDNQKTDIEELIKHILNNPDAECTTKKFTLGAHSSEYKAADIQDVKEHKLRTPFRDNNSLCFLIIQFVGKTFTIQHVLEHLEYLLKNKHYYSHLIFCPSSTYAAKNDSKDQFEGSIEINLGNISDKEYGVEIIKELIIDITDETVSKKLNLRRNKRG